MRARLLIFVENLSSVVYRTLSFGNFIGGSYDALPIASAESSNYNFMSCPMRWVVKVEGLVLISNVFPNQNQ